MPADILFLLKPGFVSETGEREYCPDCMLIEGLLNTYPELAARVVVRHVDLPRPRRQIVELVGEAQQGCPMLVRRQGESYVATEDLNEILAVFARDYGVPLARGHH